MVKVGNKIPITVLLTESQYSLLIAESKNTGNSHNSIVRTALEKYWNPNRIE